jgi:hypothetical protein
VYVDCRYFCSYKSLRFLHISTSSKRRMLNGSIQTTKIPHVFYRLQQALKSGSGPRGRRFESSRPDFTARWEIFRTGLFAFHSQLGELSPIDDAAAFSPTDFCDSFVAPVFPNWGNIAGIGGWSLHNWGKLPPKIGRLAGNWGEWAGLVGPLPPIWGRRAGMSGAHLPIWGTLSPNIGLRAGIGGLIADNWGKLPPNWGNVPPISGPPPLFVGVCGEWKIGRNLGLACA